MDIGTGDGRFVVATARAEPDSLVIGLDADAASMREASRHAAASARRGGLRNALFVVSSVETLPHEMTACADGATVYFPWGSLLRGIGSADSAVMSPLARLLRPGAPLRVILSVTPADHSVGVEQLDAARVTGLAATYRASGLLLVECRSATEDDLAATHSTWAKRLRAGSRRDALLLRFKRE